MHIWLGKIFRQLFYMIDSIVYNGITEIYRLLIDISRTSVLSQSSIQAIGNRIYQLLAIFMTFKIIFSLIMYVVNPDDFSDKSKGVSKLGLNVIITLSLLVLTPYIFSYAYQLQNIILEDNSLGTLVFGDFDENSDTNFSVFSSGGSSIAFYTMQPFFIPNASISELSSCVELMKNGKFNKDCSGIDFDADELYIENDDSMAGLRRKKDEKKANYSDEDVANYVYGVENGSLGLMFRPEMALAVAEETSQGKTFVIDYKFMFSTPIGIVVVLLLISFCMDVALRSIKLSFLQLVAPIPILSYLDPKSGKDGMFKKWYQLCFKTYISLFVRLLALYFAIFIISKIDKISDVLDGSYQSSAMVKIFVIIGALMFAKQLPKILEGLGIKLDGDGKFTLNPLKKFGEEALGGKKILGFGAAGAAGLAAGATNFASRMFHPNSWRGKDGKFSLKSGVKNMMRAPGSTIAGAASAFRRGASKAMHDEKMGKIFTNSYGEAMFAKVQREDLNRKGSTIGGRIRADVNRWTGNLNAAQRQELEYAEAENVHNATMADIKQRKEQIQRRKDVLAQEKRVRQEASTRRKAAYDGMKSTIDGLNTGSEVEFRGRDGKMHKMKIDVKGANDDIEALKKNNKYKANIGDKIIRGDGTVAEATKEDIEKGVLTAEATMAEKKLKEQRNYAFDYYNDPNTKDIKAQTFKNYENDAKAAGGEETESYDDIKGKAFKAADEVSYIDSYYKSREQDIEKDMVNIAEEEAKETDRFIKELKDRGLDKDSAEWKANEADNVSRPIKTVQPDGFKPTANVNSGTYTPYSTGFIQGNGPGGPRSGPPGPGPGPGSGGPAAP